MTGVLPHREHGCLIVWRMTHVLREFGLFLELVKRAHTHQMALLGFASLELDVVVELGAGQADEPRARDHGGLGTPHRARSPQLKGVESGAGADAAGSASAIPEMGRNGPFGMPWQNPCRHLEGSIVDRNLESLGVGDPQENEQMEGKTYLAGC